MRPITLLPSAQIWRAKRGWEEDSQPEISLVASLSAGEMGEGNATLQGFSVPLSVWTNSSPHTLEGRGEAFSR